MVCGSSFRQPGSSCKCRAAGMPQGLGLSGVVCRHGIHEQEQTAQRLIASLLIRVDHSRWQLAHTRPTVRWVLLLHGMLRLNMLSSIVCTQHTEGAATVLLISGASNALMACSMPLNSVQLRHQQLIALAGPGCV